MRVRVQPEDELVTAHLPDPGRLKELLVPDARVWVRQSQDPGRKTEWTAVVVAAEGGQLVSLDTQLPNRLVKQALIEERIEALDGFHLNRAEVPVGRSRFDFELENMVGQKLILEVKSVTLVVNEVGMFPDAPTERGARHVRELTQIAQTQGYQAAILFIVQRIDARAVAPARHIDAGFSDALVEAKENGVRLLAKRCQVTLEELVLGIDIPMIMPSSKR